jgi:hypothetical protein
VLKSNKYMFKAKLRLNSFLCEEKRNAVKESPNTSRKVVAHSMLILFVCQTLNLNGFVTLLLLLCFFILFFLLDYH